MFSNTTVAALLVVFMAVGVAHHMYRFGEMSTRARRIIDEKSAEASANLLTARAEARAHTPEEQLARLRARYDAQFAAAAADPPRSA